MTSARKTATKKTPAKKTAFKKAAADRPSHDDTVRPTDNPNVRWKMQTHTASEQISLRIPGELLDVIRDKLLESDTPTTRSRIIVEALYAHFRNTGDLNHR